MDSSDLSAHQEDHSPASVRARLNQARRHTYLKDFIYGAIDGAVTTFAVVAGVAGAGLSAGVIIILGLANIVADGFSMAASNFLASRADRQFGEKIRSEEERHIEVFPEGEQEEIRQIFYNKGFRGAELEHVVEVITSDKKQWVDTMIQEELGLPLEWAPAWKAGLATFAAFVLVGSIPLLPYLLLLIDSRLFPNAFPVSAALTGVAFFAVGALKSRFVHQSPLAAGTETFAVGGIAALIAYGIGVALGSIA